MWSTGRNVDERFTWQLKSGGVHRSQSLGAADQPTMLPSHRKHRMQYLANRSRFESEAPTEPPPPPPPLLTKRPSFSQFADGLLHEQAHDYLVDGSLPQLQIVEEPLCRRTRVYSTTSSVVDNIDLWQPKWLDNGNKINATDGDGERVDRAKVKRSTSDAGCQNGSGPPRLLAPRMGWRNQMPDVVTNKSRYSKTVRDLAEAYQAAVEAKKKPPPVLGRRSSMSAVPVKALARRFSIPNE